jgi:hypothetical protein
MLSRFPDCQLLGHPCPGILFQFAGVGVEFADTLGAMFPERDYSNQKCRVALAFSFLSAVADRFGLWGQFGVAGVSWGDFERFTAYTARLLWFLPPHLVSPSAILSTAGEVIVAGGLLVGWRLHWWAFAAAALLLSFALAMACALGVKAPTDYSVWTASAAAFLLGVVATGWCGGCRALRRGAATAAAGGEPGVPRSGLGTGSL